MTPSSACYSITKSSEGCRLKAYQDTGGVWTIGYGHTNGVVPNQVITQATAEMLLQHDMEYAAKFVEQHAGTCTQGQFDALTDFVFNVGPSQFLTSSLLKYHKAGEYEKAAAEFPKWKYDNGKVEPGLVTRRAAEASLYSRQEPQEVHQQTTGLEHSVPSVAYSVPLSPETSAVQSSPVPTVSTSDTGLASGSKPSGLLSLVLELLRKLLKPAG